MEKNTIIAVILCVIVISAGYFVQAIFFPVEEPQGQIADFIRRL